MYLLYFKNISEVKYVTNVNYFFETRKKNFFSLLIFSVGCYIGIEPIFDLYSVLTSHQSKFINHRWETIPSCSLYTTGDCTLCSIFNCDKCRWKFYSSQEKKLLLFCKIAFSTKTILQNNNEINTYKAFIFIKNYDCYDWTRQLP